MNLTALRTRVRSLTSILSTSVMSDAEMDDYINEAHNLLCLTADWPFLVVSDDVSITTGSDSAVVTVPAGRTAQRILDVFAVNQPGDKPWQLFERPQPMLQESNYGWPREFQWTPATNTITVYPAPSRNFELRVRLVLDPKRMTTGSDEPLIPEAFRHGIAYLAASLILEREADTTGRVDAYQARASSVIEEMRRLLLSSSRPTFTIGGRTSHRRNARRQVW